MNKSQLLLKIGIPNNIKKYNLLNTIYISTFTLTLFFIFLHDKGKIIGFIIYSLIIISTIIGRIKLSMKFENIGDIFIDENSIKIIQLEKEYELKLEEVKTIIFTYFLPEDDNTFRLPIDLSGFQNKITIISNDKIEYYIYCSYNTYKNIRAFKKLHKYKIRFRFSIFV
jgi:hypothetical protein